MQLLAQDKLLLHHQPLLENGNDRNAVLGAYRRSFRHHTVHEHPLDGYILVIQGC